MSLVDDLRGLPGGTGDGMADLVEQAQATRPESLTSIGTALRDSAAASQTALAPVGPAVTGLDGAWDGASADAFVAYAGSVDDAAVVLRDTAVDAADAVDALGTALEEADTTITGLGESFLSAANDELGKPGADPLWAITAIEMATEGFVASADAAVDDVETAIGAAQAALHGLAPLPTPFTDLAQPGTAGFAPAPGVPVDWAPVPDPARPAAPTSPAGGAGVPAPAGGAAVPPADAVMPARSGGPGNGPTSGSGGGAGAPSDGGSGAGGAGQDGGPARHGFGGGGGSDAPAAVGSTGGPPTTMPPGDVDSWIREAIRILRESGHPVSEADVAAIWSIISHESGGDPHAINLWDSNAEQGIASRGLMQTIPPTFDAHCLPGHGDIWNPVDNIIAGVRYTIDRYGSLGQHPGLASLATGGGYLPY